MARGQVTKPTDRRLRDRVPVPCDACSKTFDVLPSRVGKTKRCPECVEAGRYRCHCPCGHGETFVEERQGRGSLPTCPHCRAGKCREAGPRPVRRPRSERVTFTCRGVVIAGKVERADSCQRTRQLTEAEASRRVEKAQRPGAWGTSLRLEDRTWECKACVGLQRIVDMARAAVGGDQPDEVLDELDRMGFVRRPPRTLADARRVLAVVGRATKDTLDPPGKIDTAARVAKRTAKARRRVSQEARGLRQPAPPSLRTTGDKISATKWAGGSETVVRLCGYGPCGKVLFADGSSTRDGKRYLPDRHGPCNEEAERSPEVRAWLSQRKVLRDQKAKNSEIRALGPIPLRKAIDGDTQRDFTWAVRYLLGGVSCTLLANERGDITPEGVRKAVHRVVALLPEPELVASKHRTRVERLRVLGASA